MRSSVFIAITIAIAIALTATSCKTPQPTQPTPTKPETPPTDRITVLTGRSGHGFFLPHEASVRTWDPTPKQAKQLLLSASKAVPELRQEAATQQLHLQVVGVISNGKKTLFGNFWWETAAEAEEADWRLVPRPPTQERRSVQVWVEPRSGRVLEVNSFVR